MKDIIDQIINQDKIESFGDEMPLKYKLAIASLLVFAVKADGHISEDELTMIMSFLAKDFALDNNSCAELIETGIYLQQKGKSAGDIAASLKDVLIQSQKEHLLALLAKAVKADGLVHLAERHFLEEVGKALGFSK